MRVYLYILAGLMSALIGWSIGQFIIADLGVFRDFREIVLFPCIAISLATGIVLNEIFLSSPTRPKLNLRSSPLPISIAAGLGLLSGLVAGFLVQILILPQLGVPSFVVRVLGWLCIGSSVGFAEGYTWRWRSIEAGDKRRFRKRFKTSILAGSLASLLAAMLFEILRLAFNIKTLVALEDPIGFSILGILLGLAFSLTASPSYMVALRAGAGFEYQDTSLYSSSTGKSSPSISNNLRFVSLSQLLNIEEGLSIQLPVDKKIVIGSAPDVDIYLPGLTQYLAQIDLQSRESILIAKEQGVEVNGENIRINSPVTLKHNHVVSFRTEQFQKHGGMETDEKQLYRFVYYNRFLDPQG